MPIISTVSVWIVLFLYVDFLDLLRKLRQIISLNFSCKLKATSIAVQPVSTKVMRVKPCVVTQLSDLTPAGSVSRSNTMAAPVSGLPCTSTSEQESPTLLLPVALIKPTVDQSSIPLTKPGVPEPIDLMNYESFCKDEITYPPKNESLFDDKDIEGWFSDGFDGNVPIKNRNKIRGLVLKVYKMGIT